MEERMRIEALIEMEELARRRRARVEAEALEIHQAKEAKVMREAMQHSKRLLEQQAKRRDSAQLQYDEHVRRMQEDARHQMAATMGLPPPAPTAKTAVELAKLHIEGRSIDYSSIASLCASLDLTQHARHVEEVVSGGAVEDLDSVLGEEREELISALEGHLTDMEVLALIAAVERRN